MSLQALDYEGSTPFRQAAMALWKSGWSNPLPIGNGKSLPPAGYTGYEGRSVSWPDLQAWLDDESTPPNVGIRLQQTVVGIDVDAYDDKQGASTILLAEETLGNLPATYTSTSRGPDQPSRIHFYKVPIGTSLKGAERRFVEAFGADVEIIHFGHRYAVVAPSIHPRTGAAYCWYDKNGDALKDVPPMDAIPDLPQPWLAVFITPSETASSHPSDEERRFTAQAAASWVERYALAKLRNARNGEINTRVNEAGAVFSHFVPLFYSQGEAEQMIWAARAETVADEATEDRDRGSMRSGLSTEGWKATKQIEVDDEVSAVDFFTDARLGPEFAKDRLVGKYKFANKMWLKWDGRRWAECTEDAALEEARDWVAGRMEGAVRKMRDGAPSRPDGKNLIDCWKTFMKLERVKAVLRLSRGVPGVAASLADFDRNRDILNTASGIVNLRTGELAPSDPKAMCMKLAPVRYVAGAESKSWTKALEAVPEDCVDWFQIFMGQAITGYEPTEDRLLVMQGSGENGKTLVLSLGIRNVMGDYYTVLDDKVLLGEQGSGPSPELMALRGARIAVLEETQEARHLDTQRLKKIVGTGVLTGRYLFKDTVTFDTSHTMIINTNYLPRVKENDRGTWRRLMTLPFPYTYVKGNHELRENQRVGDVKLKSKLSSDEAKEAILAWLIEGAKLWYQNDKQMDDEPKRVEEATTKWRAENDVVLSFIQAGIIEPSIGSHVLSTDLLTAVNGYLREQGAHEWTDRLMADRFGNHPMMVNSRVEKKRVRVNSPSAGPLSRPVQAHGLPPTSGTYVAWIGLKFA
jgi:P4 family phage/plasmid primase-like protien